MAQRDSLHEVAKRVLVNDGWTITDDPFVIEYEDARLEADLGAEKVLAAQKGTRKIVVEIKVFSGVSFFNLLHIATGQYCNYRVFLSEVNPDRELFLAIPKDVYTSQFLRPSTQKIIESLRIRLLVFDPDTEEVFKWIG